MNKLDIIRAWKDELFRKNLSNEQQALLPKHPAGEIMLSEEDMASIYGGIVSTDSPFFTGCLRCHDTNTLAEE